MRESLASAEGGTDELVAVLARDLSSLRESLQLAGRTEAFEAELERTRSEQRRRPKLLSMLGAQGW